MTWSKLLNLRPVRLGCISQLMGWDGSGHTKRYYGQRRGRAYVVPV